MKFKLFFAISVLLICTSSSYAALWNTGSQVQLTFNDWHEIDAMPSPDGSLIVSTGKRPSNSYEIDIFNVNTGISTQLTNNSILDQTPSFTRDGQSILWSSPGSDSYSDIWKMDINGGNQRRLPAGGAGSPSKAMPNELPDGRIVIHTWDSGQGISIIDADGTNRNILNTVSGAQQPRVSNSGRYISYHSQYPYDLYIYDLEEDIETQLSFESALEGWPSFSLDDELIVYQSKEDGGDFYDLWLLNWQSGLKQQLTFEDFDQQFPTFMPDSSGIIYSSLQDGGAYNDIWLVTPEPTTLLLLSFGSLLLRRRK